jgi:nucleoside phosphorylase
MARFQRIAVVMAMHDEARPVVDRLDAAPLPHPHDRFHDWFGATVRSGPDTAEVLVAVNAPDRLHGVAGIGPEPAVVTTLHVLEHWSPDLVISAGTAGGWASSGGAVASVVLGGPHVVRHDRRIEIPGFDRFGIGSFPCVDLADLADRLGATVGVVTTGGSLDESPTDRVMIEASGAIAKDMEAAAVAQICSSWGTPFAALKVLTDLHDAPTSTAEQFERNLATASAVLADRVAVLVHELAARQS